MSIDTMKQALEALHNITGWKSDAPQTIWYQAHEAITSLRQAIATEESSATQEPTDGNWYWVRYEGLGKTYEAPALYKESAQAFYSIEFSGIPTRQVEVLCKCHPQPKAEQEPKREPLTVDEIWRNDRIMSLNADLGLGIDDWIKITDAIEAAHGIKGDA